MRLEQMPEVKQNIEAAIEKINQLTESKRPLKVEWKIEVNYDDLSIDIRLFPKYKEVVETTKYGIEGEQGTYSLTTINQEIED